MNNVESPGTSSFSIRKATAEDAEGILDCLRLAFEAYRDRYTPDAFRDTTLEADALQRRLTEMVLFVAVSSTGGVVGTVGYKIDVDGEGHLRGMAVLPHCQGSGIAQQLLAAVESDLRAKSSSRVTLDTTAPLRRATAFYERHGFRASGRVTDFFGRPLVEYVKILKR